MAKTFGAQGLAWLSLGEAGEIRSSFAKFLTEAETQDVIRRLEATPGVQSAMNSYVKHMAGLFRLITRESAGVVICEGLEDLAMPFIRNPLVTAIPNGTVLPEAVAKPGTR